MIKDDAGAGLTPGRWEGAVADHRAGRLAEAEAGYRAVLAAEPGHAAALTNLGVVLRSTGRMAEAESCYRGAIAVAPGFVQAYVNLGNLLTATGEQDAAAEAFARAAALAPDHADAHFGLGLARQRQHRLDEALAGYECALAIAPGHRSALINRAAALQKLGRLPAAAVAYRQLIALQPDDAKAHLNLGGVLTRLGQLTEAAAVLETAMTLTAEYNTDAAINLSNVHLAAGDVEAAVALLRRTLAATPSWRAHANLLFALNYLSGLTDVALVAEYRDWDRRYAAPLAPAAPARDGPAESGRRLRVGYVSADFYNHSVACFFEPLLAHHDRHAVEVVCYSGVQVPDAVTARLRGLADLWRPVNDLNDEALARQIRQDRIDILVDLAGHTGDSRLLAFARRPAPVQVTWLGYPNTTGMTAMDYRITDAVADPAGAEALHSEALVRLPQGFLCYRAAAEAPAVAPLPALARGFVTFGSFNALAKTTPSVVRLWSGILRRVPGSRLLLKNYGLADQRCRDRYLEMFAGHGIAAERVELLPWLPDRRSHLAGYHRLDIALDTFPYAGTTTTCEALWMGVPVVTLLGCRHAGRVGASLLVRLGLQCLIAADEAAYVEIAAGLAGDFAALAGLRAGLRATMAASPLCDGGAFAREMEAAYRGMWLRSCRGKIITGDGRGSY